MKIFFYHGFLSVIEDLMPIDSKIGYVFSNDSFTMVRYTFETCDYISRSMIYRDNQFCSLFKIDQLNGMIQGEIY